MALPKSLPYFERVQKFFSAATAVISNTNSGFAGCSHGKDRTSRITSKRFSGQTSVEKLASVSRLDSILRLLATASRHSILGMIVTAARLDSVLATVARWECF